jgi:hypothetical protein
VVNLYIDEQYTNQNTTVTFKENENEAFDTLKHGELYYLALDICVYKDDQLLAKYFRNFESKVTTHHFQRFIQKFLEEPRYREAYAVDNFDPWTGFIPYAKETEGNKINQKCWQDIQWLTNMKNPKFNDFANLKTYGIDGFSRLKIEQLANLVMKTEYDLIMKSFDEPHYALTALRWKARGLPADLAIRKVKTDLEIRNNMIAK